MPDLGLLWIPVGISLTLVYAFGFCVAVIITKRNNWDEASQAMVAIVWPFFLIVFVIIIAAIIVATSLWVAAELFVEKVLKIK